MVIGIGIQDTEKNIRMFAEKLGMPWPVGLDKGGTISKLYGITFGAGIVFIDRDGIIKGRYITAFTREELEEKVEAILLK